MIRQRLETYSNYNIVQGNSDSASKCVFSNRRHCPLSACSSTVWLLDYTNGTKVMFLTTVLNWLIKTATDSSDVLQYLTQADDTALVAVVSRLLSYTP